ncbi:MAG: phytoene desaturase family protein [Actinomycetales bacterium]
MARVVVIGAGMGGLSAAARLAAARHSVTVLEQAPVVGGKLGLYERDGFAFDTGPSLLTLPAVYRDLFVKTGPPLDEVVDLVEVDPVAHYRFPDGTELDVPNAAPVALTRALDSAVGSGAGEDWHRYLQHADRLWEITRGPFLESPLEGPRDLLRQARRVQDLAAVAPWRTLRDDGRRYLRDPRLRMFLDRYATYTGSDPRRAPAALGVVPYVEQTFGAWYVRGGLRRLGEALHQRVLETGATVETGADVTQVVVESGRVTGVRLADGRFLPADVVVSNADAAHLYGDLLAGVPAAEPARRRLRRATPSLSGFVILLALRGRTPGLRHHTVLFPDDYDDEFDSVFGLRRRGRVVRAARPAPDPTIYISAPDDPALRPDDNSEAWFVLVNASRHGDENADRTVVDWLAPGVADSYADHIVELMAKRGLDVRDRILWRETRSPADLAHETRAPGGAIYGTSSNGPRAAFLRAANRSPVTGLYLVGGSAHPGGGLPLVGMSAAIVAELIGRA